MNISSVKNDIGFGKLSVNGKNVKGSIKYIGNKDGRVKFFLKETGATLVLPQGGLARGVNYVLGILEKGPFKYFAKLDNSLGEIKLNEVRQLYKKTLDRVG